MWPRPVTSELGCLRRKNSKFKAILSYKTPLVSKRVGGIKAAGASVCHAQSEARSSALLREERRKRKGRGWRDNSGGRERAWRRRKERKRGAPSKKAANQTQETKNAQPLLVILPSPQPMCFIGTFTQGYIISALTLDKFSEDTNGTAIWLGLCLLELLTMMAPNSETQKSLCSKLEIECRKIQIGEWRFSLLPLTSEKWRRRKKRKKKKTWNFI